MPVSEDVLMIFVGTLLGSPDLTTRHKLACVVWCYAGVVMSDLVRYDALLYSDLGSLFDCMPIVDTYVAFERRLRIDDGDFCWLC